MRLRHALNKSDENRRNQKKNEPRIVEIIKIGDEKWRKASEAMRGIYDNLPEREDSIHQHALSAPNFQHALSAKKLQIYNHVSKVKKICGILKHPEEWNETNAEDKKLKKEVMDIIINQKWPEKEHKIQALIEDLLTNENKMAPETQENEKQMEGAIIMLEYPERPTGNSGSTFHCPSCPAKLHTRGALNNHRANSKKCKEQWTKEKNALKGRKNPNCGEFIKTEKQLSDHELYHCKNEHKHLRQIKHGIYNRRFQANTGDPIGEDKYMHNGRIKFDGEKNVWVCLDCGYSAGLYNTKAVQMHRYSHIRKVGRYETQQQTNGKHRYKGEEIECRFNLLNLDETEVNDLQNWHTYIENGKKEQKEQNENKDRNNSNNNENEGLKKSKHHYEIVNLVDRNPENTEWKCKTPGRNRTFPTSRGMATHVGKMHVKIKKTKKQCPFCPRHYYDINELFVHLEMMESAVQAEAIKKKGKWAVKTAICAALPENTDTMQKWERILEINREN